VDRNTKLHVNRSCNVENEASLGAHDLLFVLHFLHFTQRRLNIPAKFTIFVFAIILLISQCCKFIFVSDCLVYVLFGYGGLQVYGYYKRITSYIYLFIYLLSSLNEHSMHTTFHTPNHTVRLRLRHVSGLVGAIFRDCRLNLNFSVCQMTVNNCPTMCMGTAVFSHDTQFLKLHNGRFDD